MPRLKEQRSNRVTSLSAAPRHPQTLGQPPLPPVSAEIRPASPTAAACQRLFPSNRAIQRRKEPAQRPRRLASLKAPGRSLWQCPGCPRKTGSAEPAASLSGLCAGTEDEEEELGPGQAQAASWGGAARLARAKVPWRSKQEEKKMRIRTAALVSWSRDTAHVCAAWRTHAELPRAAHASAGPRLPDALASPSRSAERGWSRSRHNAPGITSGGTHLPALCPWPGAVSHPPPPAPPAHTKAKGKGHEPKSSPSQPRCISGAGAASLTSAAPLGDVACSRLTPAC